MRRDSVDAGGGGLGWGAPSINGPVGSSDSGTDRGKPRRTAELFVELADLGKFRMAKANHCVHMHARTQTHTHTHTHQHESHVQGPPEAARHQTGLCDVWSVTLELSLNPSFTQLGTSLFCSHLRTAHTFLGSLSLFQTKEMSSAANSCSHDELCR